MEDLCWRPHRHQPSPAHPVAILSAWYLASHVRLWAEATLALPAAGANSTALLEPWLSSRIHVQAPGNEAAVPVVLWEPGVCRPVPDDFFLVVELLEGVDVPGGGGGGDGTESEMHTPVPLHDVPIGQTCAHQQTVKAFWSADFDVYLCMPAPNTGQVLRLVNGDSGCFIQLPQHPEDRPEHRRSQLPEPLQDVPKGQMPDRFIPFTSLFILYCDKLSAASAAAITCRSNALSRQGACQSHIEAAVAAVMTIGKQLPPRSDQ